jgi:hypothetical protein
MARPPLPIRQVQTGQVQRTACIALEAVHHNFRPDISCYDGVHVIGPNVGGEEHPAAVRTCLNHGPHNEFTATAIELVRRLIHQRLHRRSPILIRFEQTASREVVQTIN